MRRAGLALSGLGLLVGAFALLGTLGDPRAFPPALVLVVPWLGLVASCAGAILLRGDSGWAGTASGAVLFAQGVAAITILAAGVSAERQNYWDAVHFAGLFWCATASAVCAMAVLVRRARRGSSAASFLVTVDGVLVGVCVVLLAWMTLPPVQEFEGWVARTLYLLTHG